jgi:serine/threonine protein kinase
MLQVGATIYDRYQLQQKLGHNAGRQTWLATDLQAQDEPVILKVLAFGDQVQWDHLKLFEREAQVLKQLTHSQIPKYRDYFSIDDRILWFALVQNYIPGQSFKELIQTGKRFSEDDIRKIAIDILKILQDLHELNPPVLHRDIKPSNLILGTDHQIYLVDFGAVQDRASVEGATFTVVGTYGYTPLEQFGGRAVPASDLYALGATLIHLLTGVSPADLPQRDMRIQWRDKATVDFALANWLDQLINPAIEKRFRSAREAINALQVQQLAFETAFSTTKIERPRDTSIKLKKSADKLEILIPKHSFFRWNQVLLRAVILFSLSGILPALWMVSWLVITQGMIPSTLWIALFVLVIFIMFISPIFEQTYLCFDRDKFSIQRRRFGATSNQMTGVTKDIREVKGELSTGEIIITSGPYRAGYRRQSFGRELTDYERIWLIREIRSWLRS